MIILGDDGICMSEEATMIGIGTRVAGMNGNMGLFNMIELLTNN